MSINLTIYFEINDTNYLSYCSQVEESISGLSFNYDNLIYVPTAYTSQPTIQNSIYIPPVSLSYAYYNVAPFTASSSDKTIMIYSPEGQTTLPLVYQVSYNLLTSDLTSNIQSQLYDLLYVYNGILGSTFTILTSSDQNMNNSSFNSLVSNFCANSQLMSSSLCNSSSLTFSNLNLEKAPCIDPYSNCYTAWNNFCFNDMNYDSEECLNYYQNSYNNNELSPNVSDGLSNICTSIYNSNTTQSETFWDVCSCFLPDEVYENFLNQYKLTGLTLGSPQCWYPRCMLSNSIKPLQSPICPNSTVTNCLQNSYNDLIDEDGNIDDNTLNISQDISSCTTQTSSSTNGNSSGGGNNTNSQSSSNTNTPPSTSNSDTSTIIVIVIIVIVLVILIGWGFYHYFENKKTPKKN